MARAVARRAARRKQWYGEIVNTAISVSKGMANAVNIGPICLGTTTPGLELDAMTKPTLVRVRGSIIICPSDTEGAVGDANYFTYLALWVGPAPAAGFEIDNFAFQNSDRILWTGAASKTRGLSLNLGGGEAYAVSTPNLSTVVPVDSQAMRVLGDDERLYLSVATNGDSGSSDVNVRYWLRALYLE